MRTEARAVKHIAQKQCVMIDKHAALLTDSKQRNLWIEAVDIPIYHKIHNTIIGVIHAEIQALINAGYNTVPCDLFVTRLPCLECCKYFSFNAVRTVYVVGLEYLPRPNEPGGDIVRFLRSSGVDIHCILV